MYVCRDIYSGRMYTYLIICMFYIDLETARTNKQAIYQASNQTNYISYACISLITFTNHIYIYIHAYHSGMHARMLMLYAESCMYVCIDNRTIYLSYNYYIDYTLFLIKILSTYIHFSLTASHKPPPTVRFIHASRSVIYTTSCSIYQRALHLIPLLLSIPVTITLCTSRLRYFNPTRAHMHSLYEGTIRLDHVGAADTELGCEHLVILGVKGMGSIRLEQIRLYNKLFVGTYKE